MDERKRTLKKLIRNFILAGLASAFLFASYAFVVYLQTANIKDPKKCLTTAMYKVNLCANSGNYIRYKDVPKHFFHSLILSEDAAFYSHKGFDWFEIKESFRRNILEWKFARGGSTLTQQLAKNMYLSKKKSLDRKFKEFFIAKQIEEKLSKSQILEKYVNIVEFGKGIYGLKPASRHYFGKEPQQLNTLESIYLVSLLPSPKRLGKSLNNKTLSSENLWRMEVILKRLYRTNRISDKAFVFMQMLLDGQDWPFLSYADEMFVEQVESIEDELLEEFDEATPTDELIEESTIEDNETENSVETEELDAGEVIQSDDSLVEEDSSLRSE